MRRLLYFGMLIGLLTSLSTAAGTTATLIGLLFALIGGSLLGWFKGKNEDGKGGLEPAQVDNVAGLANGLALGAIFGILLGFGLKTADLFLIRPYVPLSQSEKDVKDLQDAINSVKIALSAAPAGGEKGANTSAELATKLAAIEAKVDKLKPTVAPLPYAVNLQAGASANAIKHLGETLADEAGKADAPAKELLDAAKNRLYEFANSQQGADEAIAKLRAAPGKLSDNARAELDKIYPLPK